MNARRAGKELLLEVPALDGEERPVRVVGVLRVEAREQLKVRRGCIRAVRLAYVPRVNVVRINTTLVRTAVQEHLHARWQRVDSSLDGFEGVDVRERVSRVPPSVKGVFSQNILKYASTAIRTSSS